MNPNRSTQRPAFTLIELLIVITIIGILAGLAAVGISAASKAIRGRAIALELESLSQSIEAYKLKYGSYPPDGSSQAAFEAHFRAAFPNILDSEFAAVTNNSSGPSGTVMDPAEALVFCLGGLSKDATRPFTGAGGPLKLVSSGPDVYQYNVDRNEPFFPFDQSNLSLEVVSNLTISVDERGPDGVSGFGTGLVNDLLPVYIPKGRAVPIVYFNGNTASNNSYSGGANFPGVARPYKSENLNTGVSYSPAVADRYYKFMNDKSFQLISAGLDDHFGGAGIAASNYFTFPSGKLIDVSSGAGALSSATVAGYGGDINQLDNVTNFSEGPLSDSLP